MSLPIPELDDRRFDDLAAELQQRLLRQLPELTQITPGDPVHALVDLFAWVTETVIYRANRIPDRQRLAFLDLLQIPLRPARPARGVICIDAMGTDPNLPPLLRSETTLKAGQVTFTTQGELQPTPLEMRVLVKAAIDNSQLTLEGISLDQLRDQYGVEPAAFRPKTLVPGREPITTVSTLDGYLYLAFALNKPVLVPQRERVQNQLAGTVINVCVAPLHETDGEITSALASKQLQWEIAWWPDAKNGAEVVYLPLEVISDTSRGGRKAGVARLRLPADTSKLTTVEPTDPQLAGVGETPPEAPGDLASGRLLFWLRLRCVDDDLLLGYIGVNGIDVVGQGIARDLLIGSGTGQPDQTLSLPHTDIDESSLAIEVEEEGRFQSWQAVTHFAASAANDRVYRVEAGDGVIRFGDGIRGKRPAPNARIRAAFYRYGGGTAGNLPAGTINEIAIGAGKLKPRHEWPTAGGEERESIAQAERRIPAYLNHRDRAVTAEDFATLSLDNPVRPVARADAVPGFLPGANLKTIRRNIPGAVSLFVLPPMAPAMAAAPAPSAGMLRDLYDYLMARTLLGTELYVLSPQYQPISLAISMDVIDATTQQQTFNAVKEALLHYLWPLPPHGIRGAGWPLGRRFKIHELSTQAARVDGVQSLNHLRLYYQNLNDGKWYEWRSENEFPLADYQLPQLMAVAIQPGEAPPTPPPGFGPGSTPPANQGKRPTPVPVIPPDLCC